MSFLIKRTQRDFRPVSAGPHLAICTTIVGLGVQPSARFELSEKVLFRWEIPGEVVTWRDRDGNERTGPATISREYTRSLGPKSHLRRDLEGWRGRLFTESELRVFDVASFLGKPCLLSIVHKEGGDRVYANVAVIMAPPPGADPQASGELICFDPDSWDDEVFAKLPRWLQQRINERLITEPAQRIEREPNTEEAVEREFNDAIPF